MLPLDAIPSSPGKDDYDHSVRLETNELEQEKTYELLAKEPIQGNAVIGVAGFFLLNVVALRGTRCDQAQGSIDHIILIDRSLRVEHFWKEMQPIISSATTRFGVLNKVHELIESHKERYFSGGKETCDEYIAIEMHLLSKNLAAGVSWLSSDEQFRRVKRIFDNQTFIFKRLDLCDLDAFTQLGQILKERKISIDTAYISNCMEFVIPQPEQLFYFKSSLEQIIAPDTQVIHTSRSVAKTYLTGQRWLLAQLVSQRKNEPLEKLLIFKPIVKNERLENGDPAPGSIRLSLIHYAHLIGQL